MNELLYPIAPVSVDKLISVCRCGTPVACIRTTPRLRGFILQLFAILLATNCCARERTLLDDGWRFAKGDQPNAIALDYDASDWSTVNLPHDWSIDSKPYSEAECGGAGGFFLTGVGWYRREFQATSAWEGMQVSVDFEGVYQDAEVWLNGVRIGEHHYGYTPFSFDLTKHLRFGQKNILVVRVDNSRQPNSRWYSGSGIYRHVWLTAVDPVHLEKDATQVQTAELNDSEARLDFRTAVIGPAEGGELQLQASIIDADDQQVGSLSKTVTAKPGERIEVAESILLPQPICWSAAHPYLYTANFRLLQGDIVVDTLEIPFGVRKVEVSAEHGLLVNGAEVLLCGGNVHHDNGPLGAAALDDAEWRRVRLLKEAGFNAIRTSHNPPSEEFLRACDELGMYVVDEAFDGWAVKKTDHDYSRVFHKDWPQDLAAMIRRDHNHPAVIMWSIGNEVYERGKPSGPQIARQMADLVRKLDPTRPVTIGINGLGDSGDWQQLDPLFEPLDLAGYNYELHRYAEDHRRLPERVIMQTESFPVDVFKNWQTVNDNSYVVGDFVWSALDYLGEAGIGRVFEPEEDILPHWEGVHYPWHGANCGDLDLTGWRRPLSHYRQIVWDRGEKLYAAVRQPAADGGRLQLSLWSQEPALASWTWPGHEGQEMALEVFSRYPRVQVYLNGKLVGERPTSEAEQFRAELALAYQPGTLTVVGVGEGETTEEFKLETVGEPAQIQLVPDRTEISANGQDLCFVTVHVADSEGRKCPQSSNEVTYTLEGPGETIAVGSGDLSAEYSYTALQWPVYEGRALVILRAGNQEGVLRLRAESPGLASGEIEVHSKKPHATTP